MLYYLRPKKDSMSWVSSAPEPPTLAGSTVASARKGYRRLLLAVVECIPWEGHHNHHRHSLICRRCWRSCHQTIAAGGVLAMDWAVVGH